MEPPSTTPVEPPKSYEEPAPSARGSFAHRGGTGRPELVQSLATSAIPTGAARTRSDLDDSIIGCLQLRSGASVSDIAAALALRGAAVRDSLRRLMSQGRVVRRHEAHHIHGAVDRVRRMWVYAVALRREQ